MREADDAMLELFGYRGCYWQVTGLMQIAANQVPIPAMLCSTKVFIVPRSNVDRF